MARIYFVCLIHNKIKVRDKWFKYQEGVQRIIRRHAIRRLEQDAIPLHACISACDECQEMYPYFG